MRHITRILLGFCIISKSTGCGPQNRNGLTTEDNTLPKILKKIPKTSKKIELYQNNIEEIPINVFVGFSQCKKLDLGINYISEIQPGAFHGLKSLIVLYLWNNEIQVLASNTFRGAKNIQSLSLQKNKIHTIHRHAFKGLKNLRKLNLIQNKISVLNPQIFQDLHRFSHLQIKENSLTILSCSLFDDQPRPFKLDLGEKGNHLDCPAILWLKYQNISFEPKLLKLCQGQSGYYCMETTTFSTTSLHTQVSCFEHSDFVSLCSFWHAFVQIRFCRKSWVSIHYCFVQSYTEGNCTDHGLKTNNTQQLRAWGVLKNFKIVWVSLQQNQSSSIESAPSALLTSFRWFEEVVRFWSFWQKKGSKLEQAKSNHL